MLLVAAVSCYSGSSGEADAGPDDAAVGPDAPLDPDAAMSPDGSTSTSCDPVAQSGCSASEKCTILNDTAPHIACGPRAGTKGHLESCAPATATMPDDCAPGLVCRGDNDPRCLEFCADAPVDTCGGADICLFQEDLDGDLIADVKYCARICDVLTQDCSEAGISCFPTRDGTVCAPEGAGATPSQVGQSCDYANSCAAGLGCFRVGSSQDWRCYQICDANGAGGPSCAGGQYCSRHENDDWGVCISF